MIGSRLVLSTKGWLKGYASGYRTAAKAAGRNPAGLILRTILFLMVAYGLSLVVIVMSFHLAMKNVAVGDLVPIKVITKYAAYNTVYDFHPQRRTAQ